MSNTTKIVDLKQIKKNEIIYYLEKKKIDNEKDHNNEKPEKIELEDKKSHKAIKKNDPINAV